MDPHRLSINGLLALYPRERLLVHPIYWRQIQLDLLQCRFHTLEEPPKLTIQQAAPSLPGQASEHDPTCLTGPSDWYSRFRVLSRILLKFKVGGPSFARE